MPEGIVRTDLNSSGTSYKNGFSVTGPVSFGNEITEPHQFGATVPPSDSTFNSTPVTTPLTFGNVIGGSPGTSGFELEDGSGVLLLEDGSILLLEVQ